MKTVYIKEKDFKGYDITENFPNEVFKQVNIDGESVRVHIIKNDVVVTIKEVTESEKNWYLLQKINDKVISVSCSWFPKDLFAGVDGKFYSSFTELSKKTGWLQTANTGTDQEFFLKSKKQTIIDILKANNFDNINDLTK